MIYIVILFILLMMSAFTSGSETAFFSLSRGELESLKKKHRHIYNFFLKNKSMLLISIVLANDAINIFMSAISVLIVTEILTGFTDIQAMLIQIFGLTMVVLIFGEITPKIFANHFNVSIVKFIFPIIRTLYTVIYPLSFIIEKLSSFINHLLPSSSQAQLTHTHLRLALAKGEDHGVIEEIEKSIIRGLFSLGEIRVDEIMTPRTDVVSIEKNATLEELKEVIKDNKFSRIPVYENDNDNIVGVVYARDVILYEYNRDNPELSIEMIMRPPKFISEYAKVNKLLKDFQINKYHISFVVDEYGNLAGVVTMDDILEKIVGDIYDENDDLEDEIEFIDEKQEEAVLDGNLGLDDFNYEMNTNLESDVADSIAGFIMDYIGRIPEIGEIISYEDIFEFTIIEATSKRIEKIRVKKINHEEKDEKE